MEIHMNIIQIYMFVCYKNVKQKKVKNGLCMFQEGQKEIEQICLKIKLSRSSVIKMKKTCSEHVFIYILQSISVCVFLFGESLCFSGSVSE